MSDTDTDGSIFGGGGRIYRDSRPEEEQQDPAVPPWADQPELLKRPTPIRPSVVKTVQPPEPEPVQEPHDWRQTISSALELAGMAGLAATGFLIALWVGILIASICLLVIGVAISRTPIPSLQSQASTARQPKNIGR